jgi:hypothetical protein
VEVSDEILPLPDIATQLPDGKQEPVLGRGINTTFEVFSVLKGELSTKCLILHHYKRAIEVLGEINGPGLLHFEPLSAKRYLLFLKKESDGRFAAEQHAQQRGVEVHTRAL